MTTTTTPKLVNVDHWIEPSLLSNHGVQEDVYLTFETEWRGDVAVVEMKAHRSESLWSDQLHMGDWNIYAKDSWLGTHQSKAGGTTPTAQLRMADQAKPLVEEWLASPAYAESESAAYAYGIKALMREFRSRNTDCKPVRKIAAAYRHKLTPAQFMKLTILFDAWDNYVDVDDLTRFT